jgi:hypothetical protein
MIDKALLNTFEPFRHIAGIQPGIHRLDEVIEFLDEPEGVELQPDDNEKTSGNIILRYPSRGFSFLVVFGPEHPENPIIDCVWLESPFSGTSRQGMRLGMGDQECRGLCNTHYYIASDYEDFSFVAPTKEEEDDDDLQLWFESGKLVRIKLFRGTVPVN